MRTLIIIVAAAITVLLLRALARNNVGEWVVELLQNSLLLEYHDARGIYQRAIRNNLNGIIVVVTAAFCILFSYFLISQIIKYFDEISRGIDSLIKNEDEEIKLPPELSVIAQKLNHLKQTLDKQAQDAALAEQRKNDVVMYLAHDLKTPLTSVIGYLSLLDEVPDMPPLQKAKYVHISLDKAYRLEGLIDEFFEITRYNLQAISLTKQHIDLRYMLEQMADEFYPQLAADGKKAVIQAPSNLQVYGDPDKLARVFNNILKNAVAYSETDSVIEITAGRVGDKVSVKFQNAGGIPQNRLDAVFEKFYRLDSARSSEKGGAGLGLAIAKEIVTLHGGAIFADSDGMVTAFTVELPAHPEM